MKIKVGDEWFDCEVGLPVMVELTKQDKINIANMLPECTKYAIFPDE